MSNRRASRAGGVVFVVAAFVAAVAGVRVVRQPSPPPNPLRQLLVGDWIPEGETQPFSFQPNGSYRDQSSGINGNWKLDGNRLSMTYWADRDDWFLRVIPKTTEAFDVFIKFEDHGNRLVVNLPHQPPHVTFQRRTVTGE